MDPVKSFAASARARMLSRKPWIDDAWPSDVPIQMNDAQRASNKKLGRKQGTKMTQCSDGKIVVWVVLNSDGYECSDLVGIFETEEAANQAAEKIRPLMKKFGE